MNNTITLKKDFFFGGNATFTVDNGKGVHYTFKIRQPKHPREGFTGEAPHFVSLLTGPDNESNYSYLGMVDPSTGEFRLTRASKMTYDSTPIKTFRWLMVVVFGSNQIPDGYSLMHSGHCGCCGRLLTVTESLRNGIGPECMKKHGWSY